MIEKMQFQKVCLAALLLAGCSRQKPPPLPAGTSWASELCRCLDLTNLTYPPESYERSLHFSSSATTDKTGVAHLAPEFSGDMDHGFFLRIEEHETYTDAVLAEVSGSGMISWMWSANPTGELRLYIDDPDTPTLTMPFKDFIDGKFLPVRYPFAAVTASGHNLHFPVIHSKYLKVVLRVPEPGQLASFYYQIAWNALAPPVHPFNPEQICRQNPFLQHVAEQLTVPAERPGTAKRIVIQADDSIEIFHTEAHGIIQFLQIGTRSKKELSNLRIQAFWDNSQNPIIDCPLYLLAGVSPDFEDVASFPVTVEDNRLSIRWPMPFGPDSRIVLTNTGTEKISLNIETAVSNESPPALRLHTRHRFFQGLETDAPNVLPLAEVSGTGRTVGCTINVSSRTDQWWGEGDQIIFLDDLSKPVWRGTGTEDYFGFAWCSTKTFDHPLRGQSRVVRLTDSRNSTMHRYHLLDTLPFHTFAKFQTEAWGLSSGTMDYETLILYYSTL